tara:strand:+ start:2148 stop:2534 length:387 start_codon:yes stop_codon:yes gene_type:complete
MPDKTKAELIAELEETKAKEIALQEELKEVRSNEPPDDSLMSKVAEWLTISSGVRIRTQDVIGAEVSGERVVYRLEGDPRTHGINRAEDNDGEEVILSDPPEHEHELKVREDGGKPICSCKRKSATTN